MDDWAWEQLEPWLKAASSCRSNRCSCIVNGPTRGRPWSDGAAGSEVRRVLAALDALPERGAAARSPIALP
jgi:integrase/recombinase XerD